MNEVFSETPDDGSREICDKPSTKEYLEALRPNWNYFDTTNRIIKVQDAYNIAQSQGMEKDEFCKLATSILGIPLTMAKLFVDSLRPDVKQAIELPPLPGNERVTGILKITIKPNGEINPAKLRTAFWIAQREDITSEEFMVLATKILDCHPCVISRILNDELSSEPPLSTVESSTDLPSKSKNRLPERVDKKPAQVQKNLKHIPHTYKSRPVIPKPPKEKDFESLALKNDWDRLNHYEHMAAVKSLVNRLKTRYPLPVAIGMLAKKINRSESLIRSYYRLASVRGEILNLLEEELTDAHTAIQIESVLNGSKNIYTKKLFADLLGQNQIITIKVFREVLQNCFKNKPKNWRNRVTICRIKPDWTREGEALNEYEMTYIPFALLTDEEKKRFNFTGHKEEAYVTFQIMSRNRYAKVPMEALEPIKPT